MNKNYKTKIILLLFLALLVVNLITVLMEIAPFGKGIITNINQPAIWRSAKFTRSKNFADYVLFLLEQIPENGQVILPPKGLGTWEMGNTPSMQYFLAPREVINCTNLECGTQYIGNENTYILVVDAEQFPGKEVLKYPNNLRMLNDTWGVYGPEDGLGTGNKLEPNSVLDGVRIVIPPILLFLALAVIGTGFISWWYPGLPAWTRVGIGYGVILGLLSILTYLILLWKPFANPKYIMYGVLIFGGIGVLILVCSKKISLGNLLESFKEILAFDIWVIILLGFGGIMLVLAVGSGYYSTDAIVLWGAKGYGILSEGIQGVSTRGTNTVIYPLHIPLLIALCKDVFRELLPASKILFPGFYIALIFIMYDFLKQRLSRNIAGLSTLIYATSPILVKHARIAYANLPLTYYLVSSILLISYSYNAKNEREKRRLWLLGGVFLILVIWTRPEGIWLALAVIFVLFLINYFKLQREEKGYILVYLLLPALVFWAGWKISSTQVYLNAVNSSSIYNEAFQQFIAGDFHFLEILQMLKYFIAQWFNYETWGIIGLGLLILLALKENIFRQKNIPDIIILSSGIICSILFFGVYYIVAFDTEHEFIWWLASGFNRMIMPGMSLIWINIVSQFSSWFSDFDSKIEIGHN